MNLLAGFPAPRIFSRRPSLDCALGFSPVNVGRYCSKREQLYSVRAFAHFSLLYTFLFLVEKKNECVEFFQFGTKASLSEERFSMLLQDSVEDVMIGDLTLLYLERMEKDSFFHVVRLVDSTHSFANKTIKINVLSIFTLTRFLEKHKN
ncbi:hypothetical protein CDAR_242411 [Caerostris darwini]|uniref:Uncharacterized protein n=1 Tax=Caerostris darwini TaxID=1538125 RepID=A0AAV4RWX8_9ARAC|nr:hypothetical protein CDAR_242411 [Caerostris darwini]